MGATLGLLQAGQRAATLPYVGVVGTISLCLPFFSDMAGLVGALGFWPATVSGKVGQWVGD